MGQTSRLLAHDGIFQPVLWYRTDARIVNSTRQSDVTALYNV